MRYLLPMRTHDKTVIDQFDPQARAYLNSAVHAAGPDLVHARKLATSLASPAAMLDLGCGAGHLGFALAPLFGRVVSADPSPSMLRTVAETARQKQLPQIETCETLAGSLPFGDGEFALVSTRYSAHHWRDVPAALQEMRRVVQHDGHLLVIDLLGDESPLVDTHLQALELLRDPSHARDFSASEWRALLQRADFELLEEARWPLRMDFDAWVARMRTPAESVAAIRRLQAGAPSEVAEALAFEADGSFTPHMGLFWCRPGRNAPTRTTSIHRPMQ